MFFLGAGIPNWVTKDIATQLRKDRESLNKFDIVRKVLSRLNASGDSCLRERREVLKRVVEFEDFSTCWSNDQLEAKGLVAEIQRVVNVKDSFTRINLEREAEVRKHRDAERLKLEQLHQKQETLAQIRKDLGDLFGMDNPHRRGVLLESVLNRLFALDGVLIREAFRRVDEPGQGVIEQIDGAVELDGEIYLVEMKWLKKAVGVNDVSAHLVRVFNRGESRGIFVSCSDYTTAALQTCKDSLTRAVIVLATIREFVLLMEQERDLREFLRRKVRGSVVDKRPFTEAI